MAANKTDIYAKFMEKGVENLRKPHLASGDVMGLFSALENFQRGLMNCSNCRDAICYTHSFLEGLNLFKSAAFYTIHASDPTFAMEFCFPEKKKALLEKVVDKEIETGRFAWAVQQTRAVHFSADMDGASRDFIFHAMSSPSRTIGMFVGEFHDEKKSELDAVFSLFSIILVNAIYALDNLMSIDEISTRKTLLEWEIGQADQQLQTKIEEHQFAQKIIQDYQQRLAFHIQRSPLAFVEVNRSLQIIAWNPAAEKIFGYTDKEVVGQNINILIPQSMRLHTDTVVSALMKGSGGVSSINKNITKNGQIITCEWFNTPIMDAEGEVMGFASIGADITAREKIEGALRASEEKYRSIIRSLDEVIFQTDLKGVCLLLNPAWEKLSGFSQEESVGRLLFAFFHPQDAAQIAEEFSRLISRKKGNIEREIRFLNKTDALQWVHFSASPVYNGDGDIMGVAGIIRDITQELLVEQERERASKLESISVLAGGIAHDFNNILTAINGNIQLAKMQAEEAEETLSLLNNADVATARAADLARQLLSFAKGGKPIKKTIQMEALVHETVAFSLRGSQCIADVKITGKIWPVEADPGQISQVINNLLINADQSMPSGGRVHITIQNETVVQDDGSISLLPSGQYVLLTIQDEGGGIPPEYIGKIFDPYFTTKKKGTGLGLSTTYSIIKNHHGQISVKSEQGKGTTFFIHIPSSQGKAGEDTPKGVSKPKGSGRVMVMDDEEPIRTLMKAMMGRMGYEVKTASNDREAVQLYKQSLDSKEHFDFVMLDLTIPGGRSGRIVLAQLKEMNPKLKSIVVSGYADDHTILDFKNHGFSASLAKPFTIDSLKAVISEVEVLPAD